MPRMLQQVLLILVPMVAAFAILPSIYGNHLLLFNFMICLMLAQGVNPSAILSEAQSMAERADVVVLCLGLDARLEGEQEDGGNPEAAGDKTSLALPGLQQACRTQYSGHRRDI